MGYSSIKQNGYWNETANTLNYNFDKIDSDINELSNKTTKSKGLFESESELKKKIPSPQVGDWALVGTGFPAQVWSCNTNGIWTNTGGTSGGVDVPLTDYLTSEIISSPIDILDINVLNVNLKCSPIIVEYTGTNQIVKLNWNVEENNLPAENLDILSLMENGQTLSTAVTYSSVGESTVNVNKEGTTTFSIITSKYGKEPKIKTVYYSQYRAMYFGTSTKSDAQELSKTELTKQEIKSSPKGSYNINNPGTDNYLWLCIPENMTIEKVNYQDDTKEEIILTMTEKDNYKFYRSENPVKNELSIKITIQ